MMNNTINEIRNSLEGINSSITEAEEQISDLENNSGNNYLRAEKGKKNEKN